MTWHVVYTKPHAEKKLRDALNKQGIECYLPLLRLRKKWSDRYTWQELPAFPSYVFVRIKYAEQALTVLKMPQVIQFVISGGAVAQLSDDDVKMIQLALNHFAGKLIIHDATDLIPGEKIAITAGPFAGKEAIVERIYGSALVIITLPALGKSIHIEIPVEYLSKAIVS